MSRDAYNGEEGDAEDLEEARYIGGGGGGVDLGEYVDRRELFLPVVQSLVTALGGYEDAVDEDGESVPFYRPGDSVLAVLKDLKKLWRKDDTDDERTVARLFHQCSLAKELIGLLVECAERGDYERKIALASVDLLTALTWPIDVAQELKELAEDHEQVTTDYASLLRAQVEYKAMLIRNGQVFRSIQALLTPSLVVKSRNRTPQDRRVISLMLHFVRNLLAIRDPIVSGLGSSKQEELAHLQSDLIIQLHEANLLNLLPTIGSMAAQTDFNEHNVVILDALWSLYRGVNARDLARDLKEAGVSDLAKMLDEEERERRAQARARSTRHSRFGTTLQLRAGTDRYVLHKQNAITKSAGTVIDGIKKKRAIKTKKQDELAQVAELDPEALEILQGLTDTCIEAFNGFFNSIWKDIRMGRSKVRETDNLRAAFLARFFLDFFLVRHAPKLLADRDAVVASSAEDEEMDSPFMQLSEVLQEDTLVWLNRRQAEALEAGRKATVEVQATMDLHTAILMYLDAMSKDKHQYVKDVAADVSHRFYYFQDLETKIFAPLRIKAADLSIAYLESSVSYTYTFLRMLESFSKSNEYLFVRRRRRKKDDRRGLDVDEEERLRIEDEGPSFSDHRIVFDGLVDHLGNDQIVSNLLALLSHYQSLQSPERIKHLVSLMHRIAVKMNRDDFFYKVSALFLFQRILEEKRVSAERPGMKDLFAFIQYILRKFFKTAQTDPAMLVHAFFPKPRSSRARRLIDADSDDDDLPTRDSRIPRIPADVEIKPDRSLSWSEQLGVALRCLLDDDKMAVVTWLVEALTQMAVARREIVLSTDGQPGAYDSDLDLNDEVRPARGPSAAALDKFVDQDLLCSTDAQKHVLTFDPHFKLLLRLGHLTAKEKDDQADIEWFMPKSELPDSIEATVRILEGYLLNPLSLEGEKAKDLLRRKRKKAVRRRAASDAADEGEDAADARPRKRRKQAEIQQFKSAQFIEDSDDDPEADAAFFAREAQRRDAHRAKIQLGQTKQQQRGKGKRKQRKSSAAMAAAAAASPTSEISEADDDDADGPTSFSSDSEATRVAMSQRRKRQQQQQKGASTARGGETRAASGLSSSDNEMSGVDGNDNSDDGDEDHDAMPALTKKRRAVFASDDED